MKYKLRDYQQAASDKAVEFFQDSFADYNALMVLCTAAGKSIILADIAYRLNGNVLIFAPSKELVEQDYEKMRSYGVECSMFSASVRQKIISPITFATIGSAIKHIDDFKVFDYVLVDEAHNVSPKKGMYKKMFKELGKKVLGVTATPYRLESIVDMDWKTKTFNGAQSYLKMLTNYKKAFFTKIIYQVPTEELLSRGYLTPLRYFNIPPQGWNTNKLLANTSGSDYSDKSVQWLQKKVDFFSYMVSIVQRLLHPIGEPRRGILVFVRFLEDAERLCQALGDVCVMVSGETPRKQRERVIDGFKNGDIKVLVNVSCLTTGFDYPELDTVVFARATMSLALYTQVLGRCMRIAEGKTEGWIVDIVSNYDKFGPVASMEMKKDEKGNWQIFNYGKQLTGVNIK